MVHTRFEALYPDNCREEEIKKILGFVKAGLSCQLIGVPGVGKANLLGLLAFNHSVRTKHLGAGQKNYHFIYLNFAELGPVSVFEVNKFLFIHLLESLSERKYQEALGQIQALFKEALSLGEPLLLWQNFKKAVDLLANREGLSLIFLFDRFDQYQKLAAGEFFLNLRTLRSLAKYRFAVVFTLDRPLEQTLDVSTYREFYEFFVGHTVYLPLWDKPTEEFRLAYLEKIAGESLDVKTKERLLFLTGGHGKLTKVGAEAVLASTHPPGGGGPPSAGRHLKGGKQLEKFLLDQPDVQGSLAEIWYVLSFAEKDLLQKVIRGEKPEENEALDSFLCLDLVKKDADARTFDLTIPLFRDYLQKRVSGGGEKIFFRPETNEILKGESVISDGFTAQEFRLLKYLLENPGRVCEREEIIRAVWPEAKSAEGISDEAIDQMVFRLRKKTEGDPKNPQHLQTLKGRGFKFIP